MAWWRYNGRALARLAKDRARKGGGTSVENPRNDDAGSVDITDTGTIPSFPDGKEDPPPSPAREAFLAEVPELYRPAVLNAFRAANNPDALLMELQAIVSGMHPPAYDHATIGRAIHDLAVSGAKVTPKSLRGFCRGLVDKGPPAKGRERATAPTGTVPRLRVVGDDDV